MGSSAPTLIGYDGSPAADHAIRAAGRLLAGGPALVVVVWKAGLGLELVELTPSTVGLPPAELDVRTAEEIDLDMYRRARQLATQGAQVASEAGFEAQAVAVADDVDVPVAETIVDLARNRRAEPIVIGTHGHSHAGNAVLGRISRDVIRHAPCPVLVSGPPD